MKIERMEHILNQLNENQLLELKEDWLDLKIDEDDEEDNEQDLEGFDEEDKNSMFNYEEEKDEYGDILIDDFIENIIGTSDFDNFKWWKSDKLRLPVENDIDYYRSLKKEYFGIDFNLKIDHPVIFNHINIVKLLSISLDKNNEKRTKRILGIDDKIYYPLKKFIHSQIKSDFTTRLEIENNQPWNDDQINNFIKINENKINTVINKLMEFELTDQDSDDDLREILYKTFPELTT
jgi:hypothetical protein